MINEYYVKHERMSIEHTWSFEPLAKKRPSSEGTTYRTQSECPVIVRT
jgi:hypothetical protein